MKHKQSGKTTQRIFPHRKYAKSQFCKTPVLARHILFLALPLLLLWTTSAPLWADIVHLKKGGSLEGRLIDQDDQVKLDYPGGSIVIKKSDISRIEKKTPPRNIFAGRLKKATDDHDAEACVKLARWAYSKDLDKEYVFALRAALLIDRQHPDAKKLLQDYQLHRAKLPDNETAAQKMLQDMGSDFKIHRSAHFRICYNADDLFAEITAARLELLYYEFVTFFQQRHFEPAPITDRLEVILFDNQNQYRKYAQAIRQDMTYSSGFYSNKADRSYFYDSINDSKFKLYKSQILQARHKLEKMRRDVLNNRNSKTRYTFTDADGKQHDHDRRSALKELDRQEKKLDLQFEQLRKTYLNQNINVTIHEATHQLSYDCGILSRYYQNPKWLVEGLAMYFEAAHDGKWTKPGEVHQNRLQNFLTNETSPQRLTLDQLITDDEIFNLSRPLAKDAYASAWTLFYFLTWQQHEKLFDYIFDLSLRISASPYPPEQRRQDFEKYFGNIEQLEETCRLVMTHLAD